MFGKIKAQYKKIGQYVGAMQAAPSKNQGQAALFVLGLGLVAAGLATGAMAQQNIPDASDINYNAERIDSAVRTVLSYLEGSFGALIMVVAGVGAIMSSALGQYKAALGLLVVAVGTFILRSLVSAFFSVDQI